MAGHASSGSARGQSAPARDLFVPINFVRPQWVRDLAGGTTEVSEEVCFDMHTDADLNEDEGTVMSLHSQDLYIPSAPAPIVEPELLQPERISAEIHSVRELVEHIKVQFKIAVIRLNGKMENVKLCMITTCQALMEVLTQLHYLKPLKQAGTSG